MKRFLIPLVILIAATIYFSVFIVKEVNQAIVLQFGDPKRIIINPGINFKIPFEPLNEKEELRNLLKINFSKTKK